ncbi:MULTISPECIES: NADH-quinone oxidoreductase subunit C [Alteribacter]|uniref:NADH-quinone oxidoreductase n=1 Tax=Alteribacter keqinensis TaxID=2483800 RepID=A0A3M7TQG2_9BACI|nr:MULTISPECIES: NADH-quinone oxidoreductase subunit C [Alteribacter]MBM7095598.1 NADH-quinone oxidoreductase subunit C [Alteribacter salitolerans]RNA67808.1 NADH-quinone oxidoreductase subunit C [Alteribacter keqinensis]
MSEELLDTITRRIEGLQGEGSVLEATMNFSKPMITLDTSQWTPQVAQLLHNDPELKFNFLSCLTGIDYEEHMEVIYNLYSIPHDYYLYVKVKTPRDTPSVQSVQPIWKTADWLERETYDLLGIEFPGHYNLKRILLDDDWEGHPLRKDYVTDKKALGLD